MSDKRKYLLALFLGAVAFVAGFIFLWWLSGAPLPKERGADAAFFAVLVVLIGNLGWATVRCALHDWWSATLGPYSRKTSNTSVCGSPPGASTQDSFVRIRMEKNHDVTHP